MLTKGTLNNGVTHRDAGRVDNRPHDNVLQEHVLELVGGQVGHGVGDGFEGGIRRDENCDVRLAVKEANLPGAGESVRDAGEASSGSCGGGVGRYGEDRVDLVNRCPSDDNVLRIVLESMHIATSVYVVSMEDSAYSLSHC